MAYKRNINRLPIPPRDARVQNVTCHFCIVGCGYHAISWPVDRQGGPLPDENLFGADLSQQQGAESAAWFSPSMYNVVKQNGRDVNLVVMPDKNCVVNSGLASIRGGRIGELSYSTVTGTLRDRLTEPMVWRYGVLTPTSWDDAVDLVAEVTRRVVEQHGEDGLIVSAYDHGGAGGGYENTWATGKLYFQSMKVKNIRIHNRPAYNSEVHGTRDMGVGELNNCYEDAELADTIFVVGANSLETQTNYFLNHWVPNLRGTSMDKKKAEFGNEPVAPARIVVVDPRRTPTVAVCEAEAGKDNVLHLAINSGTDLALFNALLTEIAAKGWVDRAFIDASTTGFQDAVRANQTSVEQAAQITGLSPDDIRKAAAWLAEPKQGGARRRTMFAYEKGLIWGNDNYRTNQALVNVALATGNVGRPGGGCVRMGGHQEGYSRPDYPGGRPGPYVDQLLISGQGGVHHIWGCDHFKTTLNASEFKRAYKRRTDLVKAAMDSVPASDRAAQVNAIMGAIRQGGLFVVDVDIVPTQIGTSAHVMLPAATSSEMNLTSMNGERRMRLTERYMDPPRRRPCRTAGSSAGSRGRWSGAGGWRARRTWPTSSRATTGRQRRMHSTTATASTRRAGSSSPTPACGRWATTASGARYRTRGRRDDRRRDDDQRHAGHGRPGCGGGEQQRQGAGAAGHPWLRAVGYGGGRGADRRGRADHRDDASLRGRQVQRARRQGQVRRGPVARLAGSRQAGGEEQVPVPREQRAGEPRVAVDLPRPAQRLRPGPATLPVHPDEPG